MEKRSEEREGDGKRGRLFSPIQFREKRLQRGRCYVSASNELMGRRAPGTGLWGVDKGEARDDGTQPCSSKLATEGAHARVEVTFVNRISGSVSGRCAGCTVSQ